MAELRKRAPFWVITLNYDLLLEQAFEDAGIPVSMWPCPSPNGLRLVKPHGSIGWWNSWKGAYGFARPVPFPERVRFVYGNQADMEPLRFLSLDDVRTLSFRTFAEDNDNFYAPVVVPPVGPSKRENVRFLKRLWDRLPRLIAQVSELMVVGCSIRAEDSKLRDLLQRLPRHVRVVVADPNPDPVMQGLWTAARHLRRQNVRTVGSFSALMEELLGEHART
ncbi:MAG: SIR2 family protein [Firmicutes bacterium]|nr:SIR2 family protein [Alicyclobacillaceae bacterium]MCL6497418.1 SIR2 family protein [Bacillota bacterium]